MPPRRLGKSRRQWSIGQRAVLRLGKDFFHEAEDWGNAVARRRVHPDSVCELPPRIREEMAAAWEYFRDEVMSEWDRTGTRPWAWWQFDSPEPRDESITQADQLRRMGEEL